MSGGAEVLGAVSICGDVVVGEVASSSSSMTLALTVVGSRVPAKPLRFELWGAREVLPLPIHVLAC